MGGLAGGRAASGASAARYEYGPFHELIRASGPMASENHFLAAPKCRDSETGLCYTTARFGAGGTWDFRRGAFKITGELKCCLSRH